MVLGALVIVITGVLVVNYFKDKGAQTTKEALSTENSSQVGKTHTVTAGETLWSIAEEAYGSGYNWSDIYYANKLSSENLVIGQQLTIPDVTVKQPTSTKNIAAVEVQATVAPEATKIPEATELPKTDTTQKTDSTYTVVRGDSLWKIALKEYGSGYKWVDIAKANNLKNPDIIHAGNVLTLPR